jgi:nicotinamidase-related amidase
MVVGGKHFPEYRQPRQEFTMPASPRRALLVIDVQNEYFTGNFQIEYPPTGLSLGNIGSAMDGAERAGIPVIVIQHDMPEGAPIFAHGSPGWELHPEVAKRKADHRIMKTAASAFTGTDLAEWLASKGIDTLTIVGYMTHNCDAATIYQASHAGFKVEFLDDATGALSYENAAGKASAEEIHRVFCTVFHSNFAAVTSTRAWLDAVQSGAAMEPDNVYLSNQRARGMKKAA